MMYQYLSMRKKEELKMTNANEQVYKAIELAARYHKECVDWNGSPSIFHVLRVMFSVTPQTYKYQCAAVLHDILEDTNCTEIELSMYFDKDIVDAVKLLTHSKHEDNNAGGYLEYVDSIINSKNKIAIAVKKADLLDNMSGTRVEPDRIDDHVRCYKKHIKALCKILSLD